MQTNVDGVEVETVREIYTEMEMNMEMEMRERERKREMKMETEMEMGGGFAGNDKGGAGDDVGDGDRD